MATSTLVQYLETTTNLASGGTTPVGTSPSDRRQFETFLTETAITAGQLVAVDVSKMATDTSGGATAATVITADYNSAPVQKIVVGVAAESVTGTATSPQPVKVVVRGPVTGVLATGVIAVGDPVILDPAGAAGTVAPQFAVNAAVANLVSEAVGYALTVPAAGTCSVYVLGKGI
jgi:hypothetical protein